MYHIYFTHSKGTIVSHNGGQTAKLESARRQSGTTRIQFSILHNDYFVNNSLSMKRMLKPAVMSQQPLLFLLLLEKH